MRKIIALLLLALCLGGWAPHGAPSGPVGQFQVGLGGGDLTDAPLNWLASGSGPWAQRPWDFWYPPDPVASEVVDFIPLKTNGSLLLLGIGD
jgi:hypothetical protein